MGSDKTVLGSGRFLSLVSRDGWEFVERPGVTGIVVMAAVTDDGKLLLIEQVRHPVGRVVLELPAGLVGDEAGSEAESLEAAAQRELIEETGYRAARFRRVFSGPPSAGLSSEIITLFVATGLSRAGSGGGVGGEEITVHEVPLEGASAWLAARVDAGSLVDPKVYAGLHFLAQEVRS